MLLTFIICAIAAVADLPYQVDLPASNHKAEMTITVSAAHSSTPESLNVSAKRFATRKGVVFRTDHLHNHKFAMDSSNRYSAIIPAYWPEREDLTVYAINNGFIENRRTEDGSFASCVDWSVGVNGSSLQYGCVTATNDTTNGCLNIAMREGLSWIEPTIICKGRNLKVVIGEISFHNLRTHGRMILPTVGIASTTECRWILSGDMDSVSILPKDSSGCALIPHDSGYGNATTAWNPKEDKFANIQTGSYIRIHCKIMGKNKSAKLMRKHDDGWSDIYIPCSFDWEPGHKYVYTFTFGKGHNTCAYYDNGERIPLKVSYKIETKNWGCNPAK